MSDELKPCPFCGATDTEMDDRVIEKGRPAGSHHEYAVLCQNCGAFGPNDLGESGAIEAWNLRQAEAPKPEVDERNTKNINRGFLLNQVVRVKDVVFALSPRIENHKTRGCLGTIRGVDTYMPGYYLVDVEGCGVQLLRKDELENAE